MLGAQHFLSRKDWFFFNVVDVNIFFGAGGQYFVGNGQRPRNICYILRML